MDQDLKEIEGDKFRMRTKFSDNVTSFDNLSKEDNITQDNKRTQFHRYFKESLDKYLKQWTSDLFFLSIFSEKETSGIVANFINEKQTSTSIKYHYEYHDRD